MKTEKNTLQFTIKPRDDVIIRYIAMFTLCTIIINVKNFTIWNGL